MILAYYNALAAGDTAPQCSSLGYQGHHEKIRLCQQILLSHRITRLLRRSPPIRSFYPSTTPISPGNDLKRFARNLFPDSPA